MCRTEGCSLLLPLCPCPALPADMPSHHQLSQPMKPRLPRKLASSARINLNKYWHALEELMPVSRKVFDESDCNAINENLDNERRLAAMQLSDVQVVDNRGPSLSDSGSNPARGFSTGNIFQIGKTSESPSFPRISGNSSLSKVPDSSSFPRISDASTLTMALNIQSSDENTPPSSFCRNTSR